jgi:hypothetical protein
MVNGRQSRAGPTQRAGQPRTGAGRWREALKDFPSMRQVFRVLCDLREGDDAAELLDFAGRPQWMADLARGAESVARIDATMPCEPENQVLLETLYQLYAASRVRDILLLAHQPGPATGEVLELDRALGREQPVFRPVPVGQITRFFAGIGFEYLDVGIDERQQG